MFKEISFFKHKDTKKLIYFDLKNKIIVFTI